MKHLTTLLTILFISLLSSPSWSETYLEKRNDGLWYEDKPVWDETDIPYTGDVVNPTLFGQLKDGKRIGTWERYYKNGQLRFLSNFKDGKEDGVWKEYSENGQLKWTKKLKNGIQIGNTVYYKDGVKIK